MLYSVAAAADGLTQAPTLTPCLEGRVIVPQTGRLRLYIVQDPAPDGTSAMLSPIVAFQRAAGDASPFTVANDPRESDVWVLPWRWDYYIASNRQSEAISAAAHARLMGKRVLIWFTGDLPPIIPIENAVIFRCSLYRSRLGAAELSAPPFIKDPLQRMPEGRLSLRRKTEKPIVGFCGYAHANGMKTAYSILAEVAINMAYLCGRSDYGPVPVLPATLLRAKVLRLLARHPGLETRFIVRDRYKCGYRTPSAASVQSEREFYTNIAGTDYTVCVRGYGNFSLRFYETLACGRIPVFVDTDCVLPFESTIDWRKYCVWVDRHELHSIGDKIAEFHARLSEHEFCELQIACRRLWEERLSLPGFMSRLKDHLIDII